MAVETLKKALVFMFVALIAGCGGGGGKGGAVTLSGRYAVAELAAPNDSAGGVIAQLIDNKGTVVGRVMRGLFSGSEYTCTWQPGNPNPVAHDIAMPCDMNYSGEVVQSVGDPAEVINILSGITRPLQEVAGQTGPCSLEAINDHGACAGSCNMGTFSDQRNQAVVWDELGVAHQLDMPDGCSDCWASDINNLGQVAGSGLRISDGKEHAVVWAADGHVQKVFTEPAGYHWSNASRINDSGQVLVDFDLDTSSGSFTCPGAALYNWDGAFRLLARPGNRELRASDMNERGQVLGCLDDRTPVVWNPDGSVETLPSPHPGLDYGGCSINDNGVVVGGYGPDENHCYHAVVWTPNH
jgi:uncharacterized membrane protein